MVYNYRKVIPSLFSSKTNCCAEPRFCLDVAVSKVTIFPDALLGDRFSFGPASVAAVPQWAGADSRLSGSSDSPHRDRTIGESLSVLECPRKHRKMDLLSSFLLSTNLWRKAFPTSANIIEKSTPRMIKTSSSESDFPVRKDVSYIIHPHS